MHCKSCQSTRQRVFSGQINIHSPGYEGLTKPTVMLFPKVVICLDCGFAEFEIPEAELRQLDSRESPIR